MTEKMARTESARFAAATDRLIAGAAPETADTGGATPELLLAARLRAGAEAGVPDPVFVAGLRQELRVRAAAQSSSAAETTVRYATLETPIGTLAIAYREGRVVRCDRFESASAFERSVARALGEVPDRDPAPPPKIARGVLDHLNGRRRFTAIDLSWLPPFQQKVLEKTAEIPRGEVRPYAWIAREIGSPGAVRAVGTALGHNPIPFIVPCHRVVRSDGGLGEYSGGGPAVKERVLELEGAPIADLLVRSRQGERLRGSRTTHIVCYPSCHAARRIRPGNAAPFASFTQARASGYRPCELCRPG